MAKSGTYHRTKPGQSFGQDLMRGEHVVGGRERQLGEQTASLKGGLTLSTTTDPSIRVGGGAKANTTTARLSMGGTAHAYDDGGEGGAASTSGTSIFDPVLCELAYRWFCPAGGSILDPFAGGSVRGIVASVLGRRYTGIDLRAEQVAANESQAVRICAGAAPVTSADGDPDEVTPIDLFGEVRVKRDDLFQLGGVRGGKVRTCWALARGAAGLVTAGSRSSPQVNIVAHVARRLGIPCRVHTPTGTLSPEVQAARDAGAEVIQHKPGYNNVIIARAREDARERGWREIPFGMECAEAVKQTRRQVVNLPADARRLVVPVGSGMSLAGILHGLRDRGLDLPVLGVCVGADPHERLDEYAPRDWKSSCTLIPSGTDYHAPAERVDWHGLRLDPHYEAKCIPFLEAGDLLWCVGIRQSEAGDRPDFLAGRGSDVPPRWIVGDARDAATLAPGEYDLVFSCPPYADLERYSDDPRDLSTLAYPVFLEAYRAIVAACVGMLKPDRFAAFVVGDVRDRAGFYRNFVGDTVDAFRDAGALLYNEAILITQVGSLPIRVGKQFARYRKLGKTHQNVLVFYKGDPARIPDVLGEVAEFDPGEDI